MLQSKEHLLNAKNLLAFSAGVDSTALFFLLLQENVKFDIAIVNYGVRPQAEEEVAYAQTLADRYELKCYLLNATEITANFEANARRIRYDFFESLILKHNYANLLTAHHLGDRFEWMLMQFCKGAGCAELSGMKPYTKRQNYNLIRPLLHLDKQELLEYLHQNNIKYFEDASNSDEKYKRNEFRHHYSNPLLKKHLSGIKKSFAYIDEDVNELIQEVQIHTLNDFAYFKTLQHKRSDTLAIDRYLKSKGHVITANERELIKSQQTIVVGRKFVITQDRGYILITPYLKAQKMSKSFKEKMRLLALEPKLRGYFSTDDEAVALLSSLFA